eukprot:gi/632935035/ref/XP_007887464.1/ PREDICTED: cation-independent mannose-6-phosphate receptor [Callorhinchus milii]
MQVPQLKGTNIGDIPALDEAFTLCTLSAGSSCNWFVTLFHFYNHAFQNGNSSAEQSFCSTGKPGLSSKEQTQKKAFWPRGGAIGSCVKYADKSQNLGYVQMSPQAGTDGSLSIVYLNGDVCKANQRYSTRILFQCDETAGSPVFEESDECEFLFVWRTPAACSIVRASGENCRVKEPKYGYELDLNRLAHKNYQVNTDKYTYHFRVCDHLNGHECNAAHRSGANAVSACQVQKDNPTADKTAGLITHNIIYEDGLIMINYTKGEKCHKIYERSTAILFYCDHSQNPGEPKFLRETSDCTYLFEWHTSYVCPPFTSIDCTLRDDDGNSYDLTPLSRYRDNWEILSIDNGQKYYINVCKSLVPQNGSWVCPLNAAACLKNGTKYINLGTVAGGPKWEHGLLVLHYQSGDRCPDGIRNKTTIIRFQCDANAIDTKPNLITAIEDCVYTFLWFTAAACRVTENVHDRCTVTNPISGHSFDLNPLRRNQNHIIYDSKIQGNFVALQICDKVSGTRCSGNDVGVCITDRQRSINAGRFNQKLTYADQVLKLTYSNGDRCSSNPSLNHRSIFSFVCGSGVTTEPVLVASDEKTCTHYFSWHTQLACEHEVKCSVMNGTSVIDLSPLIQKTGYYSAIDEDIVDGRDDTPNFYINLCQPLNPIPNVVCPPGAAVCMDPVNGPPVDIGRISWPPQINRITQEVYISFTSNTTCEANKLLNYDSLIAFHCVRGIDLGRPKMMRQSECSYVFEWGTPLVCPDSVMTSGCSLTDEQLQYTFNLSVLTGGKYKIQSEKQIYYLDVCAAVSDLPGKKCKDSAVCLLSGNKAVSFGNPKAMTLEYIHQDNAIVMHYGSGDPCPKRTTDGGFCIFPFIFNGNHYTDCTVDGRSDGRLWCAKTEDYDRNKEWGFCVNEYSITNTRSSAIIFKCDESADKGTPTILSETLDCTTIFEWKTSAVCPPKRMECKIIYNHKIYDLRMLSSLTGSWQFAYRGDAFYINLCQGVREGPPDCPAHASVCRVRNGETKVLGIVYTQKITIQDERVYVNYSNGDLVCNNGNRATTILLLQCSSTGSSPMLQRIDEEKCEFSILWQTRAACAVKPQVVKMVNGTIVNQSTGQTVDLSAIYSKFYRAAGDIRSNGDQYIYDIQLSGIKDPEHSACRGSNICQIKSNNVYFRRIGETSEATYYFEDDDVDILISSNSPCGREKSKNVSSTISLHCSQSAGEGKPDFLHETLDCQYQFSWYTSAVCAFAPDISGNSGKLPNGDSHTGLSGRSRAVGAMLSVLLVVLTACLLILLLYKRERREMVLQKMTGCCRKGSGVSYKYTKINGEEEGDDNETEWLMEETTSSENGQMSAKESHGNGLNHVTTKTVNADVLGSFALDDQDSEDEVLTVPQVKINSTRTQESKNASSPWHGQRKSFHNGSDEDLIELHKERKESKKKSKTNQQKKMNGKANNSANFTSFHDDSDEDMLNV